MGYLTNFIVYTLAMVGVVMLALFIFKASTSSGIKAKSKFLKVHDSLSLGPRKTLYIVSAGEEKFLIAGDVDKTSLISRLESTSNQVTSIPSLKGRVREGAEPSEIVEKPSFQDIMQKLPTKPSYMDRSDIGIYKTQNKPYKSVMKNLAERMKEVTK